jgi:hypothetical protein
MGFGCRLHMKGTNVLKMKLYIFRWSRNVLLLCNLKVNVCLFLWLYSPILGLGRLHETFHFISVTRCRTVGRTPWTGDSSLQGLCVSTPRDCEDGEVGGMNGFGRGNWSTRRKPAPTPLCPPQIPLARPRREHGLPRWEVSE